MNFENNTITYLEIPSSDLEKSREFYGRVFDFEFTDFWETYTCFESGIQGGFYESEKKMTIENCWALIVFYADSLEEKLEEIIVCWGKITEEIFSFPWGRRFHFLDPVGNEVAVWSDK